MPITEIIPDGTFVEYEGVCPECGAVNDIAYYRRGPHIAAVCRHCDYTIQFCKLTKNMKNVWVRAVKERDGYTCQRCGVRLTGRQVDAHHLLPTWFMPERKFDIDNGICLCKACHKQIHGYGGTIK